MVTAGSQSEYRPRWELFCAAEDFFHFQNRGYPRLSCLEWVGNRHGLDRLERQILVRGVFSQEAALNRLAKRKQGVIWADHWLGVDGHNVHITVESAILGRDIVKANDGVIRDLAGQSANFRVTETSRLALDLVFRFLRQFRPAGVTFLFDAPMSHSGLLAQAYLKRMRDLGLPGEARAVPVPERELTAMDSLVASSDQELMEKARHWVDLARLVVEFWRKTRLAADFSEMILAGERRPMNDWVSEGIGPSCGPVTVRK